MRAPRAFPLALVASVLLLAAITCPLHAEALTSEWIVQLTKLGLGDDIIVAKIKSAQPRFSSTRDQWQW